MILWFYTTSIRTAPRAAASGETEQIVERLTPDGEWRLVVLF